MYILEIKNKKYPTRGRTVHIIYMNKKCKYRNCIKTFDDGRVDKEYCSVQCKRNEKKYRQRERKKNEETNTGTVH